jgi:hypothetical protein
VEPRLDDRSLVGAQLVEEDRCGPVPAVGLAIGVLELPKIESVSQRPTLLGNLGLDDRTLLRRDDGLGGREQTCERQRWV